ncbi:unnamed protein product [Bemisia tabaci]|uniref:HEAT repeat-containing protein 5A n=1 Tax=Bemisia tabaci TaxID=7038 RepID=A0A9P0EZR4_BEMTA|nr:unnamed protein product [Bemisia tabaci]
MELSHSLILNEAALNQLPENKRPIFIFEWLRYLDKLLIAAQKSDIKECQKKLVDQLMQLIQQCPGPPTRQLIAHCLATLFSVGDTFLLFDTVNHCNDILKNKDDSSSSTTTKLAAISCVGSMYEKLGRMMGRSYEETVQMLIKSLRSADSQMRVEIMMTLEKVCCGMGNAISNVHREIFKAARSCLADRVMAVRSAASKCLLEMLKHAPFMYTVELENLTSLCFRAFDGSSYEVRCNVAKLLGTLIATTQLPNNNQSSSQNKNVKATSLDDALNLLMSGFLRGGTGFLKGTGEIIKGSSTVNREVRVGVTHAYVSFVQTLGSTWLERNLSSLLNHILDVVANPKAASSHVDAVYSRKCISFILRSTLGRMLGEKAQTSACKELAHIVTKQMLTIDFNPENAKDCNQETLFSQHLLVCALHEMSCLIFSLGTTASNILLDQNAKGGDLLGAAYAVLSHPCQAARLAAAWCLRCICAAIPSQCTPMIDRCLENIENLRTSPEAVSGYSSALAAVLGGVKLSSLGVPHNKGKIIFNCAEELLRSASQNSRLSLIRTQAGWLLIGAVMTLGVPVVRGLIARMLLLWRNSFPRSSKELESEKARGDGFTWQITLEGRAGALSAMHSLLIHCPELVTDDITKRLLIPIESALAMLTSISSIVKTYGQHLKAPAAMVRLRLYETLALIPAPAVEGSYTHLLRLLVAELTLSENPANTTTSLLPITCHAEDSVILGSWLQDSDHRSIECQLQSMSAAGSGALEHDHCCLYRSLVNGENIPGPLPLGVAVIDASVTLFGKIFSCVANKHRLQMLDHFSECIKQAKSCRSDAVATNVFAALLSGFKSLTETKSGIGHEDIKKAAFSLITTTLTSNNPMLRCAAAECLGRLAQVVSDARFTAETAQMSFDRLKSARDAVSRTGHSLALGCLHKFVGGLGSSQHLNTSVSILLALAQDSASPVVQVWSLHALKLMAESGGPMFRGYVEPSLSLVLRLLLTVPQSHVDVHQSMGNVISALITTVGPELQGSVSSVCLARTSFLCACEIMQGHYHPLVQAEAISCLQQLHLFAPRHVNLSSLVPTLCVTLFSKHLLLRKAAVACLRQLAQREAKQICDQALAFFAEKNYFNGEDFSMPDSGLPGILFGMLDLETDAQLIKDIHDTLTSMLQIMAAENLSLWLSLCKTVLTVASDSITCAESEKVELCEKSVDKEDEDEDDDHVEFTSTEESNRALIQPRWPTRVFAAKSVRRMLHSCELASPAHFELSLAKEIQLTKSRGDFLVLHLSDLVRLSFMAATSDCDPLRLEGLRLLYDVITKFAKVPEPEFPGHLLLEQFQAQVGAALRPAFAADTSSHVTATACEVCSAWIGSGTVRDLSDLRRVHQLLVSSLAKLNRPSHALYNEALATLERLAILKAWAQVYIVAMVNNGSAPSFGIVSLNAFNSTADSTKSSYNQFLPSGNGSDDEFGGFECRGESLLGLVQPELKSLSQHWLAALQDYALLSLPSEFSSQLPHEGGAFYTTDTMESCKTHYSASWPPILHAAALWLNSVEFNVSNNDFKSSSMDVFILLFGISIEALCSPRLSESEENVLSCLHSLYTILNCPAPRQMLMSDASLSIELCNVFLRLLLSRYEEPTQKLVIAVIKQSVHAAQENLDQEKQSKIKESVEKCYNPDSFGEGSESGELQPGKSLVFAVLEVCSCLLAKQLPALNFVPILSNSIKPAQPPSGLFSMLMTSVLQIIEKIPRLCSPQGAVSVLPTLLFFTTSVLKEIAGKTRGDAVNLYSHPVTVAALHTLRSLCTDKFCKDDVAGPQWKALLQSTLAKIIDLIKTKSEDTQVDETVMMLAIAVFVLHAPSDVVCVAYLKYPCINHFRLCLENPNVQVRIKCVETLRSIFGHAERRVSVEYIHALAPKIIQHLHAPSAKQVSTEAELTFVIRMIYTMETLIQLVESKNRIQLLSVLVPVLIEFLLPDANFKAINHHAKLLHEISLQWLMKIGPQYPQEFKIIMSQLKDLRLRLESAVKSSQNQQQQTKVRIEQTPSVKVVKAPTIKLKTDFANFTS